MSVTLALLLTVGVASGGEAELLGAPHRFEMRVVASTKVPVIGAVEGGTTTRGISRFSRSADGKLEHRLEVCDVSLQGGNAIARTTVPEAFIRALRPKVGLVRLRMGILEVDLGEEFIGFDEDKERQWPPIERKSPGVIDSDGDGYPGASLDLHVAAFGDFKLLIAQRAHSTLLGTARAGGGYAGQARLARLEQKVLDTEPNFLKLEAKMTPVNEKSTFSLVPIRGEAQCARVFPDLQKTPTKR